MAMKVVVGLGNPGLEYRNTRHNSGFRVLDELALRADAHFQSKRDLFADTVKAVYQGKTVVFVKPTTFMNLSGRAVQSVLRWYKVDAAEMIIVHDDVSLPLGRMRLQSGGGAGGQHGIESVIESLGGNKGFDRLKFGVGPDPGGSTRGDYVLRSFPEADVPVVEKVVAAAADAVVTWLQSGIKEAMNRHNGLDFAPPPPAPPPAKNQAEQAVGETPKAEGC